MRDRTTAPPRPLRRAPAALALAATLGLALRCGPPRPAWQPLQENLPGALLAVWGTSASDVYAVGADAGASRGPLVIHFDGRRWRALPTGVTAGTLWWLHSAAPDAIFMVGSPGLVLRYDPRAGRFDRMATPGDATLFGVWGPSAADLWAVGRSRDGAAGVLWRYDGAAWQDVTATLPPGVAARGSLFKVWGTAADDAWIVGAGGATAHWDGSRWTDVPAEPAVSQRLLTVHGSGDRRIAVGGNGQAVVLEGTAAGWRSVQIPDMPSLNGVFVPPQGDPVAVGAGGWIARRSSDGWRTEETAPVTTPLEFHAVWIDPSGGTWAVGGLIASDDLNRGMIWYDRAGVSTGPVEGL